MQNQSKQTSWEEELKYKLPQIILTALEYRGFYDCGKYLDDTIWESIEPLIRSLLTKQAEEISEAVGEKKDAKWFLDNYFTVENLFPSFDREKDLWVAVVAKEIYNQALSDTLLAIKQITNK